MHKQKRHMNFNDKYSVTQHINCSNLGEFIPIHISILHIHEHNHGQHETHP